MSFRDITMIHGAKNIYFLQKFQKSTIDQHLGNVCCLNVALKALLRQTFAKASFSMDL